MNILVTGASGFIGQNLVQQLLKLRHSVITLDLKPKIHDTKHYQIDITDFNSLLSIQEDIDIIYHLAAQSYGKGSLLDPEKDLEWNIRGTLNVCRFAQNKRVKKIIYTSSMAVYGNREVSSETDLPCPLSNYGVSKLAGELYVEKFAREHSFDHIIFRLWNTYGPGQDMTNEHKGIVSAFVGQLLKSNYIKVTGSLERFRDIIYVDDVVTALLLSIEKPLLGVYNLSTGKKTTVKELLETIVEVSGKPKEDITVEDIGGLIGDQHGCVGDNTRLVAQGWKPETTLKEGISKFIIFVKSIM